MRTPIGIPADDDSTDGGEITGEGYEEVEDMDEAISDDPTVEDVSERPE